MIRYLSPRQPDPLIKKAADQEIAKFGHLNWLIGQINLIPPGGILSVVAGTNITIDNTDPANPIINSTGGAGGDLEATLTLGDDANGLNIANLDTLEVQTITDTAALPGISINNNGSTGGSAITIEASPATANPLQLKGPTVRIDSNNGLDIIIGGDTVTDDVDASLINGALLVGGLGIKMDLITELTVGLGITSDAHIGIKAAPTANSALRLKLTDVPNFASNAAALAGGLIAGEFFRTSSLGQSTVKIVE